MEQNKSHTTFPSWDELNQLFDGSLSEVDALQLVERIRSNTPEDDAAIGLKNWLEKNDYQRSNLNQWVARSQHQLTSTSSARLPLPLKVAASVAILFASAYFTYQFVFTNNAPWENNFTKNSEYHTFIGKSSQKSLWMELNRSGNAKDALSEMLTAASEVPTNETLMYYKSLLLFENNKAKEALHHLQKINYSQSHLRAEIDFLTALCHWQLKDKEKAKLLFESIVKQKNSNYSREAKEILNRNF